MLGIRGKGLYLTVTPEGRQSKEYTIWTSMLKRCYCEKQRPNSYAGCTVSENFKNFQFFAEWCNNQIGFGKEGWQLDKDILVKGNKIYSEDTCCFVPFQINYLLIQNKSSRGEYPVGIYYHKVAKKYAVQITVNNSLQYHGLYSDLDEAFSVYKKHKESNIKNIAKLYKEEINESVFNALCEREILITD